jgi:hypothetical protein
LCLNGGVGLRRNRLRFVVLCGLAGAAIQSAAAAPSAVAGTYTVYGCRTPTGAVAPLSGWSDSLQVYPAYWQNSCPTVTYMWMAASSPHGEGRYAEETFDAPPNTTIASYRLVRAVRLVPSGGYYYQALQDTSGYWTLVDGCNTYTTCQNFGNYQNAAATSNVLARNGQSQTTAVQLKIICGKSGGCPSEPGGVSASVWLFQSAVTLQSFAAPQFVSAPNGPLVAGGQLAGVLPVTISATDQGGGVYQAEIEVDGQVRQSQVLDNSTGTCQQPFTAVVPCPLSANGTLDFNTAQLADGFHSLRVIVTDAAGNTAAWGPITIDTSNNPCSPNPQASGMTLRAAFVERHHKRIRLATRITSGYATRPMVGGSLTTSTGAPVAGARICVASQADYPGAPLAAVGGAVTNGTGGFTYRLGRGPSRTLYFVHRVPNGAIASAVTIAVRAPVKVHLNAHQFVNGQVMTWKGVLPGRIPGGMLALMQVWRGSYWETFKQISVARSGRWIGRYRFRFTTGQQRYVFRLQVPHQAGYPYAAGASGRINVVVSG